MFTPKLIWRKKFAWRQWLSRFSTLQDRSVMKSTRRRLVLKKLQKISPNQLIYYKSAMYIIFTKYFSCEIKFPDYCWYGNYLLYYFLFWQKFRSFSTKQLIWRNIFEWEKIRILQICSDLHSLHAFKLEITWRYNGRVHFLDQSTQLIQLS